MSEDSSSDDDWCAPTQRQCWECGKKFSNITTLMSHYKSHDIQATCNICNITFRRLTSLSTHLDNVHSPPLCRKCPQAFSNVWELNKHAETHYVVPAAIHGAPSLISAVIHQSQNSGNFSNQLTAQRSTNLALRNSVSETRPQQRIEMKPERPETTVNSVEYTVGEDDKDVSIDSDCDRAEDSTSSDSDDEDKTCSKPDDLESDGGSSSTDDSSDSANNTNSRNRVVALPIDNTTMCASCGNGPYRSMKLHLLHCSGVRVKYQCPRCKNLFKTEASLNEHYMPLYSCEVCGQVFSHQNSFQQHPCPKISQSPLNLFCSESMPHACNICKSFFTCEKTLFDHVTRVHSSVVSTKVCIITNPSMLTDNKVSPGVHGTVAHSAIGSPNVVNQVINGKLNVGQSNAGPLSTVVKSSPSSVSPFNSRRGRPPASIRMAGSLAQTNNQPFSSFSAPTATETTPTTAAPVPPSPPTPTILAMFENDSQDVALKKRMNTGWRSKAPHPCRQCGAILRQSSLIISHRYLHRGRRLHRCQCGRAFKHRLHLLRHCVQHAEAISYICVSCGETFTGAKVLAEHIKGKSRKKSRPGPKRKRKVKTKCRMPFTCDCGQLFFRPSAYIWHQLQNRTKTKQLKKPSK